MRYLVEGWRVHLQRSLFNWHNTASFLKLNKNGRGRWQKKKAHYLCGPQSRGGAWPSPVKAPGLGPGDRRFESCRPDYKSRSQCERLFCARERKLAFSRMANANSFNFGGDGNARKDGWWSFDTSDPWIWPCPCTALLLNSRMSCLSSRVPLLSLLEGLARTIRF